MPTLKSAPIVFCPHPRARTAASPDGKRCTPATLRRGLTLVEMLVSLACVILLMLAYTQLFAEAGSRITDARANMELINRLRSATQRLRHEFAGITVEAIPWQRPEAGAGLLEIVEGPLSDAGYSTSLIYRNNGILDDTATTDYDESSFPFGDTDDVLMYTVRSKGAPFTGKLAGTTVQSETALVVWFLRPTMNANPATPGFADLPVSPQTFTLYRRVFLVMPTQNGVPIRVDRTTIADLDGNGTAGEMSDLWCAYDIAFHNESATIHVANTLADLTKRENRFAHDFAPTSFPHRIDPLQLVPFGGEFNGANYRVRTDHPRYGEDVVLTNVLGFDVQVWDPDAPLKFDSGATNTIGPGDPGYYLSSSVPTGTKGAYVDLGWGRAPWYPKVPAIGRTDFQTIGHPLSRLQAGTIPSALRYGETWLFFATGNARYIQPFTFDTWSFHYEHDGIDQDDGGSGLVDEGTDGFDNDNQYGVDDVGYVDPTTGNALSNGERETSPPYPVPLRGIKVRIRVYEPDTRQIREVSVTHSFVPE